MTAHTPGGLVKTSFAVRPDQITSLDQIGREGPYTRGVLVRAAIDQLVAKFKRDGELVVPERVA